MSPELSQSQKLDILLKLSKEFNLKEVPNDPAVYTMSCGNGYTLFACVNRSWYFQFEDGLSLTETYDIESVKVPLTNAKDARKLSKKYKDECSRLIKGTNGEKCVGEKTEQKKKKSYHVTNNKVQTSPGMSLPIVYPSEMVGLFMRFKQWTAENDVIPAGSGVVILDDDDYNYRVSIPQAHISFEINKDKAEVIQA